MAANVQAAKDKIRSMLQLPYVDFELIREVISTNTQFLLWEETGMWQSGSRF
jgi:hypothetical protein